MARYWLFKLEVLMIDMTQDSPFDHFAIGQLVWYYGSKAKARLGAVHYMGSSLTLGAPLIRRGPDHRLGETGITRLVIGTGGVQLSDWWVANPELNWPDAAEGRANLDLSCLRGPPPTEARVSISRPGASGRAMTR